MSLKNSTSLSNNKKNYYVAGLDEVGRGAIGGSVAVAVAICHRDIEESLKQHNVKDSKKLSELNREQVYSFLTHPDTSPLIYYDVVFRSANFIDRYGITDAIEQCVKQLLMNMIARFPMGIDTIIFDQGLKPRRQHFLTNVGVYSKIIEEPKADVNHPIVSAASILAKVERDSMMKNLHTHYPEYEFKDNKGYGTKEHIEAIMLHGPITNVHRISFLKKL